MHLYLLKLFGTTTIFTSVLDGIFDVELVLNP